MDQALDALVRRVDEDRWLASRFAPAPVRARLIALYAVNYEIAKTAEAVTQEAIGDIRLAWWTEAVAEIYAGQALRAHPAVRAYADAVREAALPRRPLEALIEARGKDLDARPFASWADLDAYVEATSGGLMALAMHLCAPVQAEAAQALAREAGRAWGFAGLLRAEPAWRARGRSFAPRDANRGPDHVREGLVARARAAFEAARAIAPRVSGEAWPAFGHVTFVPGYLAAPEGRRALLARQLKLIAGAATGRL